MAITPRSRGLGNIGSIVNRQRQAAPTRPAPKPAPKLAPARPNTTTLAQRQASQPFRSATKPMNKIDPMAQQPAPNPFNPQPRTDIPPGAMMRTPVQRPAPNPFNPQPRTDIPPGAQMRLPVERSMPNPFNPQARTDLPPGAQMRLPVERSMPPPQMAPQPGRDPSFAGMPDDIYNAMISHQQNQQAQMDRNRANGDFNPGVIDTMDIKSWDQWMMENPKGYYGGQQTPMQQPAYIGQGGTAEQWNQFNQGSGGGMGMSYVDPYGPAGMQPGNFGNPNPMSSDYDQLEGSAFNTNPSSGSLFGGGGFMSR